MTVGEFVDHLFSCATGWLGWTPEVALDTPIPQIMLAIEGKVDFALRTNPFGTRRVSESSETKKANAAGQFVAMMHAQGTRRVDPPRRNGSH